jgi:aerobic-type carbon monoxide dehydrogenase small subunit (CoxS/CutS family)
MRSLRGSYYGVAVRSCVVPLSAIKGKVVTLEGLGTEAMPHPLQRAFIEEQAMQCGYCINGMIMQSAALLARTPIGLLVLESLDRKFHAQTRPSARFGAAVSLASLGFHHYCSQ